MKIVKFRDGKFGIRCGWIFYSYMGDSIDSPHWWSGKEYIEKYCHMSLERVQTIWKKLTNPEPKVGFDYGIPLDHSEIFFDKLKK